MINGKKYRWHLRADDIKRIDAVKYTNVAVVELYPLRSICEPNSSIANDFVEIFDTDGKQLAEIPMAEIDSESSIGKFAVDASNTIYLVIAKNEKVEVEEKVKEEVSDTSAPIAKDDEVNSQEIGTQTEDEKDKTKDDLSKETAGEKGDTVNTEHNEAVSKLRVEAPTISGLNVTEITENGERKTKTIIKTVKKIVTKPLNLRLEDIKKKFQYFDVVYKLKDTVHVVQGQFLVTVYDNLHEHYIYRTKPVTGSQMLQLQESLLANEDTDCMGFLKFESEPLLAE